VYYVGGPLVGESKRSCIVSLRALARGLQIGAVLAGRQPVGKFGLRLSAGVWPRLRRLAGQDGVGR
jgi:hypothetical protein